MSADATTRGAPPASPQQLSDALLATGYLPDAGLATVAWLAMRAAPPAAARGRARHRQDGAGRGAGAGHRRALVRLQCYEGIDASQALYDWDVTRQVLHLRALEAARGQATVDVAAAERSLFDERFLLERPVLKALRHAPACCWSTRSTARTTSSRRSCSRCSRLRGDDPRARHGHGRRPAAGGAHVQPHPRGARRAQAPLPLPLGRAPRAWPARSRSSGPGCRRSATTSAGRSPSRPSSCAPPACSSRPASPRPWTGPRCLVELGARELDTETAAATLGSVLKYREDADRVRDDLDRLLAGWVSATGTTTDGDVVLRSRASPGRSPPPACRSPPTATAAFLTAAAQVGVDDRAGLYWAGRATLCGDPDHLAPTTVVRGLVRRQDRPARGRQPPTTGRPPARDLDARDPARRHRDRARGRRRALHAAPAPPRCCGTATSPTWTPPSGPRCAALLAALAPGCRRGLVAGAGAATTASSTSRRTLREELRRGGEPGPLRTAGAQRRPRRVVLLVDVSRVDGAVRRRAAAARARPVTPVRGAPGSRSSPSAPG